MNKIIKNKVYRNLTILSLVLLPIFFIVFHSLRTKSSDVNNLRKADYLDATQNQIVYLQVGEDLFTGNNQTNRRNNTVNLQRVIDNVSQSGGGTIVLPQGSFYFTQGGLALSDGHVHEKYVIKLRNNVLLKGAGMNKTILYPVEDNDSYYGHNNNGNCNNVPSTEITSGPNKGFTMHQLCYAGSMDMFYFNNYTDSNFSDDIDDEMQVEVQFQNIDGDLITESTTGMLVNADFQDFTIDGSNTIGFNYTTAGKGFMINILMDCDWDRVEVINMDATGFGMDCPINVTINGSWAIGNGKGATEQDGGASGFGIGTGYSDDEFILIQSSYSLNNKKFGFFFEDQSRFNTHDYYPAETSLGYVVIDSAAGGNLYDFGGYKANNSSFINVTSVPPGVSVGTYMGDILERSNHVPFYFSIYSINSSFVNAQHAQSLHFTNYESDYTSAIQWAIGKGLLYPDSPHDFGGTDTISRLDTLKLLYRYREMPNEKIAGNSTELDILDFLELATEEYTIYNDLFESSLNPDNIYTYTPYPAYQYDLDSIAWAKDEQIIDEGSTLNPDDKVTKAQFITMLFRMSEDDSCDANSIPFTDVDDDDWFYDAVCWGAHKGIIQPTNGTLFGPNDDLDKANAADMLFKYFMQIDEEYTIKYNLNGGTASGNPSTYTVDSPLIRINNPTKDGYVFDHWVGSDVVYEGDNVIIPPGFRGNIVLTAVWRQIKYNGITAVNEKNQYYLGESLDLDSIEVMGNLSNGESEYIDIDDCDVTYEPFTSVGQKTVTVKYHSFTTTFNVNVESVAIQGISAVNTKNEYDVGDSLDKSKVTVTVNYSNNTNAVLNEDDWTFTPAVFSEAGTQEVIVSYQGYTTSFNVNVSQVVHPDPFITVINRKNTYYVDEDLILSYISIERHDSNGNVTTVDASTCTYTPNHFDTVGLAQVSVNCSGLVTSFEVSVVEMAPPIYATGITVANTKDSYYVGETLDISKITITEHFNTGVTQVIPSDNCTFSPTTFDTVGTQTVSVVCSGLNSSFDVSVLEAPVSLNSISIHNSKNTYFKGETLDTTKITITGSYSNGTTQNISINSCTFNPTVLNTVGTQTINVECSGVSNHFDVTVNDIVLDSITVSQLPKVDYNVGDSLNTSGLVLLATYNNSTSEQISSGYTTNPANGTVLNESGSKTIQVTYGGKTTSYNITVTSVGEPKLIVKNNPTKMRYLKGEKLDLSGLELEYTDTNGTSSVISSGYTSSIEPNTALNTVGPNTITLTYRSLNVNIIVSVYELSSITLEGNYQTKYYVGDKISYDNLTIKLNYSDGTSSTKTSGFSTSIDEGTVLSNSGDYTITVSYNGLSANYVISVYKVNEVAIKNGTISDTFTQGDKLDLSKVVLIIKYNDGTTEEISSGFESSLEDGTVLGARYDGYELTFTYRGVATSIKLKYQNNEGGGSSGGGSSSGGSTSGGSSSGSSSSSAESGNGSKKTKVDAKDNPKTGGFVSITIVVSAVVGAVYLYKYAGKKIIKKI